MKILVLLLALLMLGGCGEHEETPETAGTTPETYADPAVSESVASTPTASTPTESDPPETESIEVPEEEDAGYRELRFTAKDGYQAPLLIRITSSEDRETVYDILSETAYLDEAYDYTSGCDRDLFTGWLSLTECYNAPWFESHDLYIAVLGEDSSTPRYSAKITDGGQLKISATQHELFSDDLIGRHILIEVEKGEVLTWSRTDGICYTAAELIEIH